VKFHDLIIAVIMASSLSALGTFNTQLVYPAARVPSHTHIREKSTTLGASKRRID
jgi:hypothetical protein